MSVLAPDRRRTRTRIVPTIVLLLGALYTLIPIIWVISASTKTSGELFTTFSFLPGTGFIDNIIDLSTFNNGQYWLWGLNSLIYAGGGALISTLVSASAGYALARFQFRGRALIFTILLAGVLLPQITLAIPQYFLMTNLGLANTYWSVLLPSIINPFGIYLACIYAQGSVPEETIEAARIDGASEFRVFRSLALPMMLPGLVTVFMLQFIGIWNNFLLPFIMLSDESMFPLTTGLYLLLNRGTGTPVLYTLAITGALISIIPLVAMMLFLQRYWRLDLLSGSLKG
ncbi:multiple sugar transport system permease protein [Microbacterium endophyticum]|uniref:Multiple sugar transport system permease protein n=1 Tax=Microbacterium endophyticum TaxID=1526412 RepID=A0A7W4V578_9MICO|nr:carbohydrate ABC transporter permease [Microbacterium endophyticum]MBB2976505.1 multiple sugar transport system permease protein [Microbacterium endophyticum]NIK35951.1 multiple sugar transport system permease protein [Microbacterium endophyticum]